MKRHFALSDNTATEGEIRADEVVMGLEGNSRTVSHPVRCAAMSGARRPPPTLAEERALTMCVFYIASPMVFSDVLCISRLKNFAELNVTRVFLSRVRKLETEMKRANTFAIKRGGGLFILMLLMM